MIRQKQLVRDRVVRQVRDLFLGLKTYISCLPELEADALDALGGPKWFDNVGDVAELIMRQLGGEEKATDPRFSKTRRAVAKLKPKKGAVRAAS